MEPPFSFPGVGTDAPRGVDGRAAGLDTALLAAALLGALAWPGEVHPEAALVTVPAMLFLGAASVALGARRLPLGVLLASAYLALALSMSALASGDRDTPRAPVALAVTGLLLLLTGTSIQARPLRRLVTFCVLVAGTWAALRVFEQKWNGLEELRDAIAEDPLLSADERAQYGARIDMGRPWGPFSLPGVMGGALAGILLLGTGAATDRRWSWTGRAAAGLAAGCCAVAVLLSRSPAALLAVATALSLLGVCRACRGARAGPRRRLLLALGLAVLALASVAVALDAARRAKGAQGRGSLALRVANWRAAGRIWGEAPILGVGPGGFAHHYFRAVPVGGNATKHAHSIVARTLAETGAVGLVGLLLLGAFVVPAVCQALAASSGMDLGWALAGTSLAAHALVDIDLDLESLSALTPLSVGMAMAARPPTGGNRVRWPAVSVLVLCGLGSLPLYVAHARARALVEEAVGLLRSGDSEAGQAALREAIAADPWNGTARLVLGSELLLSPAGVGEAVAVLEEARSLSPERGMTRAALATAYARAGRLSEACREAAAAGERLPHDASIASLRDKLCAAPGSASRG